MKEFDHKLGILERKSRFTWALLVTLCLLATNAMAFTPGKTYDASNVDEIKEMLLPSIYLWVTEDQYVMKTGEIDDFRQNPEFQEIGKKNEGKFDIDGNGILVTTTGETPGFFTGYPFPTIDTKDPKSGAKIIENMFASRYWHLGTGGYGGYLRWINQKRLEREVSNAMVAIYYQNRKRGELANPNKLLSQRITYITKPMELLGTTSMANSFMDNKTDTAFAYVPAVRRVRRTSAATRSDPFLGSDATLDDTGGFDGKAASMRWKLLEEKTMLIPVPTLDTITFPVNPDGSYTKVYPPVVNGYEDKTWNGPAYSLLSAYWIPRQVYILEATPKDPYYNYSRVIYVVDKENAHIVMKEMDDRSGEFWKTMLLGFSKTLLSTGEVVHSNAAFEYYMDWKARHVSVGIVQPYDGILVFSGNLPEKTLGPGFFSEANLKQLSK